MPQRSFSLRLRFIFAGLLSFTLAEFFAIAQSWGHGFVISADVLFMLLSGGCTVLAFVVVRRWGREGKFGKVYFGTCIGMSLIFLGDVTGGVYDIVLRVATPFPSLADVFYLLGYAVASVSLLTFLWYFKKAVDRKIAYKIILVFVASTCSLSFVFLFSHSLTGTSVLDLDVAYAVLDSFVITLAVIMLLVFSQSKFISPPWRWFALGLLLIGVAHFLNGLGNAEGWYSFPDPVDLIYLWGYVSFGLGFSIQADSESL